ncbi:glutamyl-tRNA synthetase [Mesoplasma entomophilum]|uniref:Glutamate--tRNA ligase n=1 Tax=Mesoplasma entomophilum TaxID=2149 RepID=A0A3S5XZX3_9MOLU|nr:glutamate--tRNA ligase [Mesoplasma entomophilum]ATQ35824.1 glutamate--tRNA ligase [Mesoplasma entomophilum]ATZ19794.1 glutamyl-tRNA synthetase [Mesoplasma entomophilum]
MTKFRLRYAPSPTGFLHIGNTRTALMNYLFAKHYNGDFIVRIEDTDLERNVDVAIESQFENLSWLGINADESFLKPGDSKYGKYMQSQKFERYEQLANELISQKKAYRCFCTTEELEKDYEEQVAKGITATKYSGKCAKLSELEIESNLKLNKDFSIRFLVPETILNIKDFIKGDITFDSKELGDFVILKTNKIATYNFAVVVDDFDMEISHVLRGEEHISNTPRQILIYQAFGWDTPEFGHMSLIVDSTGKKLSKRSGNALFFIEQYKNQGYLPEAMFNYISLLGWSPVGEKELLTKQELISMFDDKRFSKSPSTFDMTKMKWINSQYMKALTEEQYLEFTKKFINQNEFNTSLKTAEWLNQVLLLFKKELEFAEQINNHLSIFFKDMEISNDTFEVLRSIDESIKVIEEFKNQINGLSTWEVESIKLLIKSVSEVTNKKGKELFMPIRIAASNSEHGPSLADVIYLLGKEKVLANIAKIK